MKKMGFVINGARCNGCGACLVACKVEHGITETGTWLPPACVVACANGAIEYGLIEDLRAKYPDAVEKGWEWARKNFGLAGPGRTRPNVVIVPLETKVN